MPKAGNTDYWDQASYEQIPETTGPCMCTIIAVSAEAVAPLTYGLFHGFRSCFNTWKEQGVAVGYPGGHHLPWGVLAAPLGLPPHL